MIKWTDAAVDAALDFALSFDALPSRAPAVRALVRAMLDKALAAQAETDPWLRFLAGRWQDAPPMWHEPGALDTPTVVSRERSAEHIAFVEAPRHSDADIASEFEWWSEPLPERMPGDER